MKKKLKPRNRFMKLDAQSLIKKLFKCGYSTVTVERCLGLPMYTLSKDCKWSPIEVALLRLLVTYPWLVEVATLNYDPILSQVALAHAGINQAAKLMLKVKVGN